MPRIAVISTAHIHSKQFLKDIAALTSAGHPELIWDANEERGRQRAAENNCRFVADLGKAAADPQVDGFVICAENTQHLPLLEKVLPIGKPVMCEKPLATTTADAQCIASLAARHKSVLMSGYFQPFQPGNRGVVSVLEAAALGQVTHANFRNAHHAAYGRWFDSPELAWFADPDLAGGGALLDMGTHAVHLLRHLFGPVDEVWSMRGNVSGNYDRVDDYGLILMRFASGVLGRVEAAWVFTGGHQGLEIIGTKKSLWMTDRLVMGGPGEPRTDVPAATARPDRIARLVAAIRGELSAEELKHDLEACLDTVLIMAAAYESGDTGRWQAVERL
ncbi:MAG: Gfo/Idh/MocA family oxidoreductase [Planctomycetes bacterium]|nr:Gfo/Idh/MocA family oxidoreductase [Planctomycetota bacterium]